MIATLKTLIFRLFKLNSLNIILKKKQIKDQNTNLVLANGAAACFIAMSIKLYAGSASTQYNVEYFYSNYSINSLILKKDGVLFNKLELFLNLRGLYLLLVNAGYLNATFSLVSAKKTISDAIVLNYASNKRFGRAAFFEKFGVAANIESLRYQIRVANDLSTDFMFVLDAGMPARWFIPLNDANFFIIGISTNPRAMHYFDVILPIAAANTEIQYYFLEFITAATVHGYGARCRSVVYKKTAVVNNFIN